jgi:hypothetical protein
MILSFWFFAQEFSLVFCGICPTIWFLWSIVGSLLGMLTQWWCVQNWAIIGQTQFHFQFLKLLATFSG